MNEPRLTRRDVVGAAALSAGALAIPGAVPGWARKRPALARAATFPAGVASGLPATDGVTLWTRFGGLEGKRQVRLEVARDRDFRRVVARRTLTAGEIRDHTVRARVAGRHLRPDEQYFYRFATRTDVEPGRPLQDRAAARLAGPVRIGFFSCQRYEHGFFTPQAGLAAEEDLDLVVSLGDYVYDEDASAKVRKDGTGAPNGHAETLAQWRAKYGLYRSDERLQAMHAAHPFVAIWDDCEVEGNWAGDEESASAGPERDPRQVPFLTKRRNAWRAFFEYMPLERFPEEPNRIYRDLRLGANADLFLLDTRQYRGPQPCEGGTPGRPCPDAELTDRARLGAAQEQWLRHVLGGSRATWKVLGNANMMMALDLPAGAPLQTDSWDGYGVERRRILEWVRAQGIQNLTSIVGDVHVYFAGDLTTDGRSTGQPVGTEFVGASISHDALNATGRSPEEDALLTERIQQANPHLRYANFRHHGYAVLEARPDELRVDFRAVRSVREQRSDTFTLKSFRVAAGDPRVHVDGATVPAPGLPLPAS
jgi:alkaline phosphatase D